MTPPRPPDLPAPDADGDQLVAGCLDAVRYAGQAARLAVRRLEDAGVEVGPDHELREAVRQCQAGQARFTEALRRRIRRSTLRHAHRP